MAVAEVGSSGNCKNTSAGGLHLVHDGVPAAGRTKRRSQPMARAARASPSYPGRATTAIRTRRAIRRPSPPSRTTPNRPRPGDPPPFPPAVKGDEIVRAHDPHEAPLGEPPGEGEQGVV